MRNEGRLPFESARMSASAVDRNASFADYRRLVRRRATLVALLFIAVATAFALDLATGASQTSAVEVLQALQVLALILALVAPWSYAARWKLTALRLGEDRARSFGINVGRLRFAALLRVSLLAATAVAFVGTIGFIGLVGPHIARLLIGEDHRFFLPASALAGALVMSLSSVAGKAMVPGVLVPVGIVTALVGVPVFVTLILARRERR